MQERTKKIRATFIDNSVHFSSLVPSSVYTVRRAEKLTDNRPKIAVIKTKYYVLIHDKYTYSKSLLLLLLLMTRLFTLQI